MASLASCVRRGLAKAIACPTLVRGAWGDLFLKASLVDELGAAGRPAPDERKRQPPPEGRRTCLLDLPHAGPLSAQLSRSAYVRNLIHGAYS